MSDLYLNHQYGWPPRPVKPPAPIIVAPPPKLGKEGGDICNRQGCDGIIDLIRGGDGDCSCHLGAPCWRCEETRWGCPECGWRRGDAD